MHTMRHHGLQTNALHMPFFKQQAVLGFTSLVGYANADNKVRLEA